MWAALLLVSLGRDVASQQADAKQAKKAVCHVPPGNPKASHTLQLPEPAVRAHMKHGDRMGACPAGEGSDPATAQPDSDASDASDAGKVLVCHIPPGNPAAAHTLQLPEPAVRAHMKHGDRMGACQAGPEAKPQE